MTCPVCGEATTVVTTRRECDAVYRYRKCKACDYTFYTAETESGSEDFRRLQNEADRLSRKRRKDIKK